MSLWLDIICIAILAICALGAYFKGFVKTCLEFVALFVAFIGAQIASAKLSVWFSKVFIEPAIVESVKNSVTGAANEGFFGSLLGSLGFLKEIGIKMDEGIAALGELAGQQVASSMGASIAHFLLFVICFVVILLILRFAIVIIDGIFKLPVLKSINRLAGLLVGTLKGILLCFVFAIGLVLMIRAYGMSGQAPVTSTDIEQTMVTKIFYNTDFVQNFLTEKPQE